VILEATRTAQATLVVDRVFWGNLGRAAFPGINDLRC
jgi:hypothetical protein